MSTEETALALPKLPVVDAADATWELQKTSPVSATGFEIVRVPIPASIESLTPLQVAIIMQSQPMWSNYDLAFLFYVQLRCKQLGLDPMSGDLYAVDGRLSTSDDAKIQNANHSGKIEWKHVGDPQEGTHPITGAKDIYCEATIKHKDHSEPETYKAWYSEWNNGKNANWKARPVESLQRKALARLCHRMFPMTDGEDSIPADSPYPMGSEAKPYPVDIAQELRSAMTVPSAAVAVDQDPK